MIGKILLAIAGIVAALLAVVGVAAIIIALYIYMEQYQINSNND